MKKYYLISSFFFATTYLVGSSILSAHGALSGQDDQRTIGAIGKSKFIEQKIKQQLNTYRLSGRGDLPCFDRVFDPLEGEHGDYVLKAANNPRRLFYTPGDGDCLFWATDITRQEAIALWLQHSGDAEVRRLAAPEIFDSFSGDVVVERTLRQRIRGAHERLGPNSPLEGEIGIDALSGTWEILKAALFQRQLDDAALPMGEVEFYPFPETMRKNPLYVEFKAQWNEIQNRMDKARQTPEIYPGYRQKIAQEMNDLKLRIKNEYCLNENIYRDYVTHCLSRQDQFVQSTQEDDLTYFVDALSHTRNKNFLVWAYNDDRTALIKAHEYIKHPDLETQEVILDNYHYTRVVPVNNPDDLARGLTKEKEYLAAVAQRLEQTFKSPIIDHPFDAPQAPAVPHVPVVKDIPVVQTAPATPLPAPIAKVQAVKKKNIVLRPTIRKGTSKPAARRTTSRPSVQKAKSRTVVRRTSSPKVVRRASSPTIVKRGASRTALRRTTSSRMLRKSVSLKPGVRKISRRRG